MCFFLAFSNMMFLTDTVAYGTSVSSNIDRVQLFGGNNNIPLTLKTNENDAVTTAFPDVSVLSIQVYPTDSVKDESYYCKLYYYSNDSWTTESAWNKTWKKNGSASLDFKSTRVKYATAGVVHRFKLEINSGSKGNITTYETYYFNLIRSVGLSGIVATGSEGQSLVVKEQDGNRYVIACPYDSLNLTCTAKTPAYAQIKVSETPVDSGSAYTVDLTKYTENSSGQKEIPVSERTKEVKKSTANSKSVYLLKVVHFLGMPSIVEQRGGSQAKT